MPKKDELSQRRYRNLVDHLEGLMRAGLNPEYEGYYGQLILSSDELAELGELDDVRRAAREAGRRLGWKPTTKFVGERLFIIDDRDVPEQVYEQASNHVADRMDELSRPLPRLVDGDT
ncbi:hypothetical protein [Streptomyces olivaceiscleroticus]|uniref:Uncharacterized protein n=1 Tax=Streptomyces olivaceiscleroticus TaxID=68245 RepID=A0ABP3J6I9_9ACTN